MEIKKFQQIYHFQIQVIEIILILIFVILIISQIFQKYLNYFMELMKILLYVRNVIKNIIHFKNLKLFLFQPIFIEKKNLILWMDLKILKKFKN